MIISHSFGQSKVVSLAKFLKLVPFESYSDDLRHIYYAVFPQFHFAGLLHGNNPLVSSWTEMVATLRHGNPTYLARRELNLLRKMEVRPDASFLETLEDIVADHALNFGAAEYLVRIGPRHWMAADPRDYVVFAEGQRLAFVSLSVSRNNTFVSPRRYTK